MGVRYYKMRVILNNQTERGKNKKIEKKRGGMETVGRYES